MLNDRHLCSSVLCSQKDSCGSQVVHDGQFGDGCHHYLWQTPQQSVPPGGGSKSFNVSGTTNCRQWLPPPAFRCTEINQKCSFYWLLILHRLRQIYREWDTTANKQNQKPSTILSFIFLSWAQWFLQLCGLIHTVKLLCIALKHQLNPLLYRAWLFSVLALPGILGCPLLPIPANCLFSVGRLEGADCTAEEFNGFGVTSNKWPTPCGMKPSKMELKHATLRKHDLQRKHCRQLVYADTQFMEWKIFYILLLLLYSLSQASLDQHRTALSPWYCALLVWRKHFSRACKSPLALYLLSATHALSVLVTWMEHERWQVEEL